VADMLLPCLKLVVILPVTPGFKPGVGRTSPLKPGLNPGEGG